MLTIKPQAIKDVKLLFPKQHFDDRGYLAETMREQTYQQYGLPGIFAQENQSLSLKKSTVRGLHAQKPPYEQAKLIRVLRGKIYDVAVDIRRGSPTFGTHVAVTLTDDELSLLYIPPGFLHSFCTLTDNVLVQYKMSAQNTAGQELGVQWDDPALGIDWPVNPTQAILSDKDKNLPCFADMPHLEW